MTLAQISKTTHKIALLYAALIEVDHIDAAEVIGTAIATEKDTIIRFLKMNLDRPIQDLISELEEA